MGNALQASKQADDEGDEVEFDFRLLQMAGKLAHFCGSRRHERFRSTLLKEGGSPKLICHLGALLDTQRDEREREATPLCSHFLLVLLLLLVLLGLLVHCSLCRLLRFPLELGACAFKRICQNDAKMVGCQKRKMCGVYCDLRVWQQAAGSIRSSSSSSSSTDVVLRLSLSL